MQYLVKMKVINITQFRGRKTTRNNRRQSRNNYKLETGVQTAKDEEEHDDKEKSTPKTLETKSKSMPATKRIRRRLDLAATAAARPAAITLSGAASM